MRRLPLWSGMLMLVLAAPVLLAHAGPAAAGDGYRILGDMAVMDQGRIKPLHTVAIARVKSIYTRQTMVLTDPKTGVSTKWDPVAAVIDWTARPDFWNNQEFIYVEFLPLKRMILAGPIKAELAAIAAKPTTSAPDRAVLERLAAREVPDDADLGSALKLASLSEEDKTALNRRLLQLLGDKDHKWVSPNDLDSAVLDVDGRSLSFLEWLRSVMEKQERASRGSMGGRAKLPPLEAEVREVGIRLFTYQATRDLNEQGSSIELAVFPRPSTPAYLSYCGAAEEKIRKAESEMGADLTPLENNTLRVLSQYLENIPPEDRATPGGHDEKFDARFSAWLRQKADWVPLRIVLKSDLDELEKAGFPMDQIRAFRTAFQAVEEAEAASPGRLPADKAQALIAAARDLGNTLGTYPEPAKLALESHYNRFAPFYQAPICYGVAVALLLISLGITARPQSFMGQVGRGFYYLGMLAFVAGIGLEIYGFYLRVTISGWAPVTNMYETVIWVALVTSVIGLIMELIYRKTYPALGASGIALIATVLAANVPLMDPTIGPLPPVLRSNYWLTIHVLTIVSSYAAFALALGVGLLAIGFYLTATYRHTASFARLGKPLLVTVPIAAIGALGLVASMQGWLAGYRYNSLISYSAGLLFFSAWPLVLGPIYAMVGELANRRPWASAQLGGLLLLVGAAGAVLGFLHIGAAWLSLYEVQVISWAVAIVGLSWIILAMFGAIAKADLEAALSVSDESLLERGSAAQPTTVGGSSLVGSESGGGTATLTRPTLADIRSRIASNRPQLDPRGQAMQVTAARIKPLSEFVYRAMQVGVLLCAAGTILGGVWADKSWGRFWGWDAKEVWALATLVVYLIPLHGRFAGWVNTFGLAFLSVLCFASVLMAWYGVNFVLGVGLHTYGFVEGGGQGIVLFTATSTLAVALAAGWRRSLSRQPQAPAS